VRPKHLVILTKAGKHDVLRNLSVQTVDGCTHTQRDGEPEVAESGAAASSYLMSFTCALSSPPNVTFLAVKDSPKLEGPWCTDSSSIRRGAKEGTLYFGSPAELPYTIALINTNS
jgi:hypothetical protein